MKIVIKFVVAYFLFTIFYSGNLNGNTLFDEQIVEVGSDIAAHVKSYDIDNNGFDDLLVSRDDSSGWNGGFNEVWFNDNGRYSLSKTDFGLEQPEEIDIIYFNEDRLADLIIRGVEKTTVWIQNRDRTFVKSNFEVNKQIYKVVKFDIDLDGDIDLLFSAYESQIFLNNGNGNYVEMESEEIRESSISHVKDLNNDGYPDFINGNYNVYINNKNLGFELLQSLDHNLSFFVKDVEDLDNDGIPEIVIYPWDTGYVEVWKVGSLGLYEFERQYAVRRFIIEDVNNDHYLDLVGFDKKIYLNNGRGQFDSIINYLLDDYITEIYARNMDDTPQKEIIINGGRQLQILSIQNEQVIVKVASEIKYFYVPGTSLEFTDLNSDGLIDIVHYAWGTGVPISIYVQQNDSNYFIVNEQQLGSSTTIRTIIKDINGDSKNDIVEINDSRHHRLWINQGKTNFKIKELTENFPLSYDLALEDLDNDGDVDFLVNGDSTTLWLNDGVGNFTESDFRINESIYEIQFLDINNDGLIDFSARRRVFTPSLIFYINNGDLTFTERAIDILYYNRDESVAFVDINNDGYLDIFNTPFVYLNDGALNFNRQDERLGTGIAGMGTLYLGFDFGDIDLDGDLDYVNGFGYVYLNNGDTTFEKVAELGFERFKKHLKLADVDQDSDLDLIASTYALKDTVYFNNGLGEFSSKQESNSKYYFSSIPSYGDLDGDDKMDIVFSRHGPNHVWYSNFQPRLLQNDEKLAFVNLEFSHVLEVVDPEGDDVNYVLIEKPSWISFDNESLTITGVPKVEDVGINTIQIMLEDNFSSKVVEWSFEVKEHYTPLAITSSPPLSVNEWGVYSYEIQLNNVNGLALTYSNIQLPEWLDFIVEENKIYGFTNETGEFDVSFTVSDGITNLTQSFTVTIESEQNDDSESGGALAFIYTLLFFRFIKKFRMK